MKLTPNTLLPAADEAIPHFLPDRNEVFAGHFESAVRPLELLKLSLDFWPEPVHARLRLASPSFYPTLDYSAF